MSEKAYVCRMCDALYWEPVSCCDCDFNATVFDEVAVVRTVPRERIFIPADQSVAFHIIAYPKAIEYWSFP
jgi:hypothetical protein